MEQTLYIENNEIRLKFNDGANCWQTKTIIDNLEIELEIDFSLHKDKEVDWTHFKDFISFLNKENRLTDLIKDSNNLVTELGKAFFRNSLDAVADYKMEFSNSIFYNGKTDGTFVQNGFSYSLIYNYWTKRQDGIHGDDYGLYLIDIENHFIVGAKRRQC